MAVLLRSRAFLAEICFLSPETLPGICGSSTSMSDFFAYHRKTMFNRFPGQASDIRTMQVFWLLTAGKAGYGLDFLRAASPISLMAESAHLTQPQAASAQVALVTFDSTIMARCGSLPKADSA